MLGIVGEVNCSWWAGIFGQSINALISFDIVASLGIRLGIQPPFYYLLAQENNEKNQ